jgi:NADH:ubiquinone reductase (H+-translocating)
MQVTMQRIKGVHAVSNRWRVIIVGSGVGGLRAAQALKSAPIAVTLIDRRNYHLFQPLLYQVATGSLLPGQIAAPLRSVLSRQNNGPTVSHHDIRTSSE